MEKFDKDIERQKIKNVHLLSLIFTEVVIIIAMITFLSMAWKRCTAYSNEVLNDEDDDHQAITTSPFFIFGVTTVAIFCTIVLILFIVRFSVFRQTRKLTLLHELAIHLTISTIVIFVSFFSPYMLLALVNDPLQTSLTYLFVTFFCILLVFSLFFFK